MLVNPCDIFIPTQNNLVLRVENCDKTTNANCIAALLNFAPAESCLPVDYFFFPL